MSTCLNRAYYREKNCSSFSIIRKTVELQGILFTSEDHALSFSTQLSPLLLMHSYNMISVMQQMCRELELNDENCNGFPEKALRDVLVSHWRGPG